MEEEKNSHLQKQFKTQISHETVFLWADIQYLKSKEEISKNDSEELERSYFVLENLLNISQETRDDLKTRLQNKITKEDLERAEKEIFDLINSEEPKNALYNFGTASIYCKRFQDFFIPIPECVLSKALEKVDDASWRFVGEKEKITMKRRVNEFRDYFVSKYCVPFTIPMKDALEIMDPHFRINRDSTIKSFETLEQLGPNTSVIYSLTQNFLIKIDYCFLFIRKTLSNGWDVAFSCSVDHVRAPEKKGIKRGFIPLFAYILRAVDENSCEFIEISYLSLEGQKLISFITDIDFLIAGTINRHLKIHRLIMKKHKKKNAQHSSLDH